MGIAGLLPLLHKAQRPGHIEEFKGQTVGVDSYIWLYRGAFSCASDLALGLPATKYITTFMNRAKMLRHYGIEPLFVFDGGHLPSKLVTEMERQRQRGERRQQAIRWWNQNKKREAYEMFQRCLEITPWMAKQVIEELKKEGFRYLVAPYEADAQLAYLERSGAVSAVVSEDSDLIVFGCRRVLFKLDQYGECVVFDRRLMFQKTGGVNLAGWNDQQVRQMCILSGCDYLPSVPGVGLKRAYKYTARTKGLEDAIQLMRTEGLKVPEGYMEEVRRAELTFRYQRVYDPRSRRLAYAGGMEAEEGEGEMPFIGKWLEPGVARDVAEAVCDPITFRPFGGTQDEVYVLVTEPPPTPAPTPARKKAKSLMSFWAKPKPLVKPSSMKKEKEEEEEVVVKFRKKDRTDGEVQVTSHTSRFFSSSTTDNTQVGELEETPVVLLESQCKTVVGDSQAVSLFSQPKGQTTPVTRLAKRLSMSPKRSTTMRATRKRAKLLTTTDDSDDIIEEF